jgi:hypothetical protein
MGEDGSVQTATSPSHSEWSVTAAKSSGRSNRAVRIGRPSASTGLRPIASPRAKR